jgi:hypothetical protein
MAQQQPQPGQQPPVAAAPAPRPAVPTAGAPPSALAFAAPPAAPAAPPSAPLPPGVTPLAENRRLMSRDTLRALVAHVLQEQARPSRGAAKPSFAS